MFNRFWNWYEKHLTLNTSIATILFTLQLFHLYWLTTHVVLFKLTGTSFFNPSYWLQWIILTVDYLEIPAIISTTLVYFYQIKQGKKFKGWLYLILINSQWLHLFWITDEYVLEQFGAQGVGIPALLAWIAIGIDYLELPVIFDTLRQTVNLILRKFRTKS